MKNIKRILSLIIVMALLLTMMAVPAMAKDSDTNETDIIGSLYLSATPTTITVRGATGSYSFRIDDSTTWTTNATFSGLYPNTEHTVYAKLGSAPEITVGKITTKASESHTDNGSNLIDANAVYKMPYTSYVNSFELKNDLTFRFYLKASKYTEYTNIRIFVERQVFDLNSDNYSWVTSIVYPEDELKYVSGADRFVFSVKNIAAKNIGDTICVTIYAENKNDGKTYISPLYTTSMHDVALQMFSSEEKKNILLADFLNYCAESQLYFGYNVKNLVNSDMGAYATYATTTNPTLGRTNSVITELPSPKATFSKYTLNLGSKISLNIYPSFSGTVDTSKLKLKVDLVGQTTYYSYHADGGYFAIDGIPAKHFGTPFTFTVYEGSTPISNTIEYSIENRARSMVSDASFSQVRDLLYAMIKYSRSARDYFS